jgi:hypothetical protein
VEFESQWTARPSHHIVILRQRSHSFANDSQRRIPAPLAGQPTAKNNVGRTPAAFVLDCMRRTERLSPLPQLFPRLDEILNLPGRGEMVAGDPATEITTLIEIAHRAAREMREPMTQVF